MESLSYTTSDREKLCESLPPKRSRQRRRHSICFPLIAGFTVLLIAIVFAATLYYATLRSDTCEATYRYTLHKDSEESFWVKVSDLPRDTVRSILHRVHPEEKAAVPAEMEPLYLAERSYPPESITCTNVNEENRIDCDPRSNASIGSCFDKGCCWNPVGGSDVPSCYFPPDYVGYKVDSLTRSTDRTIMRLSRRANSMFTGDSDRLRVEIINYAPDTVRVKLYDPDDTRFIVPTGIPEKTTGPTLNYHADVNEKGDIKILRTLSSTPLFQTNVSNLIFAKQFMQMQVTLPSRYIYGLGENQGPLLKSTNWTRYTLWNYGAPPVDNTNLYGTHPFYLCMEEAGNSHGVFLYNSNAMDVILTPNPAILYRPIGGIFDFFIFLGPEPNDVVQQYTALIGRPFMPPYWSLGFHLSRYGYNNLDNMNSTLQRNLDAGVPVDTQWHDIDYMEKYNDFTFDKARYGNLPQYVRDLQAGGRHYVPIVDPAVSGGEKPGTYPPYDDGRFFGIFVRNSTDDIFLGKVWNLNSSVFVDFTHPNADSYWYSQFRKYFSNIPLDGVWIDMNEPTNFLNGTTDGCDNTTFDLPEYQPGSRPLNEQTVCMTAKHYIGNHFNVHNVHAYLEAKSTFSAIMRLRQKRPFIISRASYAGQGQYSGHWSGDIDSTWKAMQRTIPDLLNFNLFGMPMMGSDICGFQGNTTEELCARWQALGAFYPFSRNHNDYNALDQDPAAMGSKVLSATKKALGLRYFLLPYLYTLFRDAHVKGSTVARPLFFEFPGDRNTYAIDDQFMLGSGVLVIPVLKESVTTVEGYLPQGIWYHLTRGTQYESNGENFTFAAPLDEINVLVRGGMVIPTQKPAPTTTESRKNPFSLLVAPDMYESASGYLYTDDGESLGSLQNKKYSEITFLVIKKTLLLQCFVCNYKENLKLDEIQVYGVQTFPEKVTVNHVFANYTYVADKKMLYVPKLNLTMDKSIVIEW